MSNTIALAKIVETIMFENWLRFYFIHEADNKDLIIRIPEKGMSMIEKSHPQLAGLAETLNNNVITHESSMQAVCVHVAASLSTSVPDSVVEKTFGSPEFQLEVNLFGTWVQPHEAQLDESFFPFEEWLALFKKWRESDKVQQHVEEINSTLSHTATTGTNEMQ